jgi:hypothetical protein
LRQQVHATCSYGKGVLEVPRPNDSQLEKKKCDKDNHSEVSNIVDWSFVKVDQGPEILKERKLKTVSLRDNTVLTIKLKGCID